MYGKTVVLILGLAVLLAGLLILRQQRLEEANRMVLLHRDLQEKRQQIWHEQAKCAQWLSPPQLQLLIEESGLELLPPISSGGATEAESNVRLAASAIRRRQP